MKKKPTPPAQTNTPKIGPLKRSVMALLKSHRELSGREAEELSSIQRRLVALRDAAVKLQHEQAARLDELVAVAQEEHGPLEIPAGHQVVDVVEETGTFLTYRPTPQ